MVANDQAYDSHAAQGLLLNNDKAYCGKDTGGTARDLLYVSTGDNIIVGEDNVLGHTVINAGSSKLVKIKVLRQDNTSNTYEKNTVILTGWGYKEGNNTQVMNEAFTFGITFDQAPVVVGNFVGFHQTTAPSAISNLSDAAAGTGSGINVYTAAITTTGATAVIKRTSIDGGAAPNLDAGTYWGYGWIAIGELS